LVKELVTCEEIPIDIQTTSKQNTPLHLAASRGHLDVVQFLAEQGANLALTDRKGGNALHYAASGINGEISREIIEYLVSRGMSFLELANNSSSPLSTAVFTCNIPVIEYWEDNYGNNFDKCVSEITQRALKIARYRKKHIHSERILQTNIIRVLENFMENRKDKNKERGLAK
jgi:hypothetical protein